MKTIDMTPTWSAILPLLLELTKNPNTYKDAVFEMARMAKLADAYIESQKTEDF